MEKTIRKKVAEIVSGVAEGCVQSGAALIGGETAEHPGLMPEDEYDLAGFAVGVIDKKDLLTGKELNGRRCPDRYGVYRCSQQWIFTCP